MKTKVLLLALMLPLVMISCKKADDFEALNHPIVAEGEFDPVLGFPVAKMVADVPTLLGMIDTNHELEVYIDSNDLVGLRYSDTQYTSFDYMLTKGGPANQEKPFDTIRLRGNIQGTMDIDFFEKMEMFTEQTVEAEGLFVTMDAFVQGIISDSLTALTEQGVRLYFDSIMLHVECADGFSPTIPLVSNPLRVTVAELAEGKNFRVVENFDCHHLVNRKPEVVSYTIRMNIAIPLAAWITHDSTSNGLEAIGLNRVDANIATKLDFPLQFYCTDFDYTDYTVDVDMGNMQSIIDKIHEYGTLNDSSSYMVFEGKNYIPLTIKINAAILDSNNNVIMDQIFPSDSTLYGAPLRLAENSTSYVSDGYTTSRVVLPIDNNMLEKLTQMRHLRYKVNFSTSTLNAPVPKPTVMVRKDDVIDLRAYIVLSPHFSLSIPIEINRN